MYGIKDKLSKEGYYGIGHEVYLQTLEKKIQGGNVCIYQL